MRNFLLNITSKLILPLILVLSISMSGFTQTISLSVGCSAPLAANEFQFDVFVTNTGASSIQFNSAVVRLTHSAVILAGGTNTLVFSYISGSDFPNVWPPVNTPTFIYNSGSRLMSVSTSTSVYLNGGTCAAPNIAPAETKKIGRFSLKNTAQNFVPGSSVGLAWSTSGMVGYINCATGSTTFNAAAGNTVLTAPCALTIPAGCTAPTVNSNPSDQLVCNTGIATFTGSFTGGSPAPALIWQVQTGGVGLFTDLTETAPYSGTATGTLTVTNPNSSLSTNRYRLKALTSGCSDVVTNSALLTVSTAANVNNNPGDQSVCNTGIATFTGSFTGGSPAPALIWQVQTGGVGLFTDLTETAPYSGTATGTLTVTNPNISLSTNRYRLKALTSGCSDVVTNSALLTVSAAVNAGVVSGISPLCINNTATYTSNGDAGGVWSSTNTGVAIVDVGGVVTPVSAGITDITYTVNSGCGSPVSAFKTLTVTQFTTLAGMTGGPQICVTANVAVSGSSFSDGSCSLIAKIVPNNSQPVTGSINTCVRIENNLNSYQGSYYVQRVYDIEPAVNAEFATAKLTLYYTQAEFDAYNTGSGSPLLLPATPTDPNMSNIRITQYHGTGTFPGNYNGIASPEVKIPLPPDIVWNAANSRWEISFDVNGFSGFYLTTKTTPLPVSLLNFSGKNTGNNNLLEWTTSSEQNSSYFELQRSTNGVDFVKATTVNAAGNSSTSRNYNYSDNITTIAANLYYYRLKMVDVTGSIKYSTTVKIRLNSKGFNVEATPNPFADHLKINIETELTGKAQISIKDISGRKIRQTESMLRKGNNALQLTDLANMPSGVYLLTIATDSQQQTIKVIRQ